MRLFDHHVHVKIQCHAFIHSFITSVGLALFYLTKTDINILYVRKITMNEVSSDSTHPTHRARPHDNSTSVY